MRKVLCKAVASCAAMLVGGRLSIAVTPARGCCKVPLLHDPDTLSRGLAVCRTVQLAEALLSF